MISCKNDFSIALINTISISMKTKVELNIFKV